MSEFFIAYLLIGLGVSMAVWEKIDTEEQAEAPPTWFICLMTCIAWLVIVSAMLMKQLIEKADKS